MLQEMTNIRARYLQRKLDDWYVNEVLKITAMETHLKSKKEMENLSEWIIIKISKDKHWNDIYSAYKDKKIVSQLVLR